MAMWNLWHGCHKISPGCAHCYVYRRDESIGIDSSSVHKTSAFGLPLQVRRDGRWQLPAGSFVWTCFTTVEDQQRAEERLPVFREVPAVWKGLACEPLLEALDLNAWLGPWLRQVSVGDESGREARTCDYEWVLSLRRQCVAAGVPFSYHQTGARLRKDGRTYFVPRRRQHAQAAKAGIDWPTADLAAPKGEAFIQQTLFEGEEEHE